MKPIAVIIAPPISKLFQTESSIDETARFGRMKRKAKNTIVIASPPPLGTGDVCELRTFGMSRTPFRSPIFISKKVNSTVDTNVVERTTNTIAKSTPNCCLPSSDPHFPEHNLVDFVNIVPFFSDLT